MLKKKMISLLAFATFLSGTGVGAQAIEVIADKENYTVSVSGCFENAPAGSYVTVEIAADDFSVGADNGWINNKKLLYFLQTQTDENGNYSFDVLDIDSDAGNYICTVRNITSDTTHSKEFFMPSSSVLTDFIDAVNKDDGSVSDSLEAEIENKNLGIDVSLYSILGKEAKKAVVNKLFASPLYTSVKFLEEDIIRYSCIYGVIKNETYEGALSYFEEPYSGIMEMNSTQIKKYLDIENFKKKYSGTRFFGMEHEEKLSVIKTVAEKKPESLEEFYNMADIALISADIENADGYNEVNTVLNNYKDCLNGLDFEYYNDFEKRNSVDKELYSIGSFKSKELLYETIDDLIKKYRKSDSSGSSGSNGGGGGGSYGGAASVVVKNDVTDIKPQKETKPDIEFVDMKGFEWAQEYVVELYNKGIVSGRGEGMFCPGDKITREEFVTMIVKASGFEMSDKAADFADVIPGSWYEAFVSTAYENSVINGMGDDLFGVGKNITRQDMAVIVNNCTRKEIEPAEIDFTDAENITEYAKNGIARMVASGVLSGYPDGSFAPQKEVTRAEAAVVIYKMLAI